MRANTTVNPLQLGKANNLVISGFYRFSRNLMYLGMLFVLVGVVVWNGTISGFFILPAFIWFMNEVQIIPEKHAMEELFGEQYLRYKQRVRRWL